MEKVRTLKRKKKYESARNCSRNGTKARLSEMERKAIRPKKDTFNWKSIRITLRLSAERKTQYVEIVMIERRTNTKIDLHGSLAQRTGTNDDFTNTVQAELSIHNKNKTNEKKAAKQSNNNNNIHPRVM